MSSDVCKHCTHAGCLDVCPTGALFRTEFGTVVVQADVCNGCGTCVAGCPFGVIERRSDGTAAPRRAERSAASAKGEQPEVPNLGVAQKCTLCYDRLHRRPDPGLRADLPDHVDQVRRPRGHGRRWPRSGSPSCTPRGGPRRACTAPTNWTASAAPDRSSCSSTSPRCTGCRRTRGCPRPTCRGCSSGPGSRRPGWPPRPCSRSWEDAGDDLGIRQRAPAGAGRPPPASAATAVGARGPAARTARARCRWCPRRSSPPTTAVRWSSRRRGVTTSRRTCSSAASRAARPCWPPARSSPGGTRCAATAGWRRSARSAWGRSPWCATSAGRNAS